MAGIATHGAVGEGRALATDGFDVVTGAFSYSGSSIARQLLSTGRRVRTLTGHPERAGGERSVDIKVLTFDDPISLTRSLEGATTLYNTYWVRFPRGRMNHAAAVANSRTLFCAARDAGVERIVHISITHPSISSPYAYFRGKAEVERALAEVGVSYAVLRPAILFGGDGVLINNIAWLLRRLPVFAVGGSGFYRIRPIHVDDLASLAIGQASSRSNRVIDAVGPEQPSFFELVSTIRDAVGSHSRIVRVPGAIVPTLSRLLGLIVHDVLLTKEEYKAMATGLADTDGPPTGTTRLSEWIAQNAEALGRSYANDIVRHFR